ASRERRDSGAFYTPHALVVRTTDAALDLVLAGAEVADATRDGVLAARPPRDEEAGRIRDAMKQIRVLDPACGSGAFLVHVLERIGGVLQTCGDDRPLAAIRRHVLTRSIFGVDINPMAVWLCELRLWLAVVLDDGTDDPLRVAPLPNLDHNIRCGDSLAGGDFAETVAPRAGRLRGLRSRYARATGPRKRSLARALDREERTHLRAWLEAQLARLMEQRRALVQAARGRDLFGARRGPVAGEREALRALRTRVRETRARLLALERGGATPFAFAAHFPDVAQDGGFDLVIGNPPWVRVHRIPPATRERWRREFRVFRGAAWEAGVRAARAGRGFGAQIDVAALFVERGLALARPGGILSLLVPAKLWRSLAGGGVRRLLLDDAALRTLEDWSEAPPAFDAATYPSLIVAQRVSERGAGQRAEPTLRVHRGRMSIGWRAPCRALVLDESPGAPWLTLPPDARAAFDRLARDGVALAESGLGHPTLGVKCGCNDAFLAKQVAARARSIVITDGSRDGEVEADWVRPVLRGEAVRPWRRAESAERLVYPCDDAGRALMVLPAGVRAWLVPSRSRLVQRSDVHGGRAWWSLFRTESAVNDRPRVVWADLGRAPQALVLSAGDRTVALNSCYVLRTRDLTDALALAALLNSSLAAAWLGALAEPARGGYRRFLAWTMARLPVPDDWARAREILAPLGARGWHGDPPARAELLEATLDAFRCRLRSMSALLSWTCR
ncbi:MAG TPA: DNA methyltransferase, partial [Gemmatimonadaceae bacterium]|nr:DNA methyltransferase [Gemmatimonadaceae bacterium]